MMVQSMAKPTSNHQRHHRTISHIPITPLASSIIDCDTGLHMNTMTSSNNQSTWQYGHKVFLTNLAACNDSWHRYHLLPQGHTVTYDRIVVPYSPQKADPYGTQLTIGGDCLHYPHHASTSLPTSQPSNYSSTPLSPPPIQDSSPLTIKLPSWNTLRPIRIHASSHFHNSKWHCY